VLLLARLAVVEGSDVDMGHGLPGAPTERELAQEAWAKHQDAEGQRHREILRRAKHFDALLEALDRLYVHTRILRSELKPESRGLKMALDNAKAVRERARDLVPEAK